MQKPDTRLSTTRYQKKINEIEKYVNLYYQKLINRLKFLKSVSYNNYKK